jgi:hypothetical protein
MQIIPMRSIDEPNGQNYIPLAPDFTSTGGVSFQNGMDFQEGYRYLKKQTS